MLARFKVMAEAHRRRGINQWFEEVTLDFMTYFSADAGSRSESRARGTRIE